MTSTLMWHCAELFKHSWDHGIILIQGISIDVKLNKFKDTITWIFTIADQIAITSCSNCVTICINQCISNSCTGWSSSAILISICSCWVYRWCSHCTINSNWQCTRRSLNCGHTTSDHHIMEEITTLRNTECHTRSQGV